MALTARARLAHRLRQPRPGPEALGAILLARSAVSGTDLALARTAAQQADLPLAEILLARGHVAENELLSALAECHGLSLAELPVLPTAAGLDRLIPADAALALDAVPTGRMGNILVVATCRPDRSDAIRAAMAPGMRAILTLAPRADVIAAQLALYGEGLARLAEGQAPQKDSCRSWRTQVARRRLMVAVLGLGCTALVLPALLTVLLWGLALMVFAGNMLLKIAAFAAALRADRLARARPDTAPQQQLRHPMVSLIVPLYREPDIAGTLIAHLGRLDYPPERLEVLLVMEADDAMTRQALSATALPPWCRLLTVPDGHPRTKPRALNFALHFARGEIVGVYDAEDRPEPDQIRKIAEQFAECPPEVACLQGRLDYYNARHNLMSRLFAIEYANWFRVLLPGVQHLGLVVPLGGTTLFLRRATLVALGGWDAHNVTEDAELGLRLARAGYRTEIVDTTTFEEANAAILPWVRQRARWQKGYLMTWAMAMRAPRALWRDLGALRFFALQAQILGAVAGFILAPLLWSLMIKPFGQNHPLDVVVGSLGYGILATAFGASIVVSLALSIHATRAPHLRHLRMFIPLSELYFLLATVSAWRAVTDLVSRPFWWAKTDHGRFGGVEGGGPVSVRPSAPPPSDAPRRRSRGGP